MLTHVFRKSMIVQPSPILGRCHSPLASPLYSPKVSESGFLWSGGAGRPAAGASLASRYRWEIQHRKGQYRDL